jgi:hypothetical protein
VLDEKSVEKEERKTSRSPPSRLKMDKSAQDKPRKSDALGCANFGKILQSEISKKRKRCITGKS